MVLPRGILRRNGSQQGFTLIELIVVILIILILVAVLLVAILAIFGSTKKSVTKTALESLGGAWNTLVSKENWHTLAVPKDAQSKFTDSFRTDAKIMIPGGLKEMAPTHKSMLLALMMCPTRDNWDRAMAKVGGVAPAYDPPISEESSRAFRFKASNGWEVVRDGWDNELSYEIDFSKAAASGVPTFTLISAGEDKDFATTSDNLYWTKDKGFHTAP